MYPQGQLPPPQRKNLGAPIYNYACKQRTLGLVVLQKKSNEQLL